MRCPDRTLLATPDGPGRLELLRHVRGCGACRAAMAEDDPSALFRLLALQPLPAQLLDEVSANVNAALDARTSKVVPIRPRPRRWVWAAVAAALLVAVLAWPLFGPQTPAPAADIVQAVPAIPAAYDERATVELLGASADAQLVDLDVDDVQLVMIFDEEIDL